MNFTMKLLAALMVAVAVTALTKATAPPAALVTEEAIPDTTDNDVEEPESESAGDEDEAEPETTDASEEKEHNVAKRSVRCGSGWIQYGHRCIHYFPAPRTWALAQRHCQSLGGNIVSVHSMTENMWLKRLVHYRQTWVGLSDAQQEQFWFWIDGTKTRFVSWCSRLGASRTHNCARLESGGNSCWNPVPCTFHHGYVCATSIR